MNRNLPVRTYQRRNDAKLTVNFYQPLQSVATVSKALNDEKTKSENESLDNDPFDTTFDRIARNAKLPLPPAEAHENMSYFSSSYDTSKHQSVGNASSLCVSISLSDINLKPVRKRRRGRKKEPQLEVVKGVVSKNLRSKSQNNKSSCSKSKNVSHKSFSKAKQRSTKTIYKRKTAKRGKEKAAINTKTALLHLSPNSETSSDSNNFENDLLENRKRDMTKKMSSENNNNENDTDISNLTGSLKLTKLKSCSVVLDNVSVQSLKIGKNHSHNTELDSIIIEKVLSPPSRVNKVTLRKTEKPHNNNSGQISASNIKQCSVQLDKLAMANGIEKRSTNGAKYDSALNMKQCSIKLNRLEGARKTETPSSSAPERTDTIDVKRCFIKLDRLTSSVTEKSPINGNKVQMMISSTPIGKTMRLSKYPISFSPILVNYADKTDVSDTKTENTSISLKKEEKFVLSLRDSDDDPSRDIAENDSSFKTELSTCFTSQFSGMSVIYPKEEISVPGAHTEAQSLPEEISEMSTDIYSLTVNKHAESSSSNLSESKSESIDTSKEHVHSTINITKVSDPENSEVDFDTEDTKSWKLLNISSYSDRSRSLFGNTVENNSNVTNSRRPTSFVNSSIASQSTKKTEMQNELYETSVPLKTSQHSTVSVSDSIKIEDEEVYAEGATKIGIETIDCKGPNLSHEKDIFKENDTKRSSVEAYVLLTRLQDPFRVTNTRKRYRKWNVELTNICENSNVENGLAKGDTSTEKRVEYQEEENRVKKIKFSDYNVESDRTSQVEKSVYLKPGKSWARSLSILNNIQNEWNLDELSVGKGKKWRHSVKDILNMQKQGLLQSCIKGNENEEESRLNAEAIDKSQCALNNNSLGRLSKRVSIRVVPNNKTVKCVEDARFLEAYGIVPIGRKKSTVIRKKRTTLLRSRNDKFEDGIFKTSVTATPREVVLQRCIQDDYMPISDYFPDLYLEHCRKIGEGVYGEVFLYEIESHKSVIKIIPIEGNDLVNGEPQKKFHEILSEIVIAKELHNLRFHKTHNTNGFVGVKNIKCIIGKYPEKLIELWNLYDEEKNSENDCPSMFNEDQLYIVLELIHGGQDLEAFVFQTAEEAYALFAQAAFALAVAEMAVEFEHRDMHWGNILISRTDEPYVCYKLNAREFKLLTKGVQVSIIDFTLSRMSYQGCCIFNDLASDPALFTAQGEYQFEIYRLMRDRTKNDWQRFEPYTNVLWLHYTLDKMITAVRYKRRMLKVHKNAILNLEALKQEILSYTSAFDFVTNCDKLTSVLCTD